MDKNTLANVLLVLSAGALLIAGWNRLSNSPEPQDGGWVSQALPGDGASYPARVSIELMSGDTAELQLDDPSGARMVIAYRTTCRFCAASRTSWADLMVTVPLLCSGGAVLLSAEPVEVQAEYWREWSWRDGRGCKQPVIGRPLQPDFLEREFGVEAVPTHFFIGGGFTESRVWRGAITSGSATRTVRETLISATRSESRGRTQNGGVY